MEPKILKGQKFLHNIWLTKINYVNNDEYRTKTCLRVKDVEHCVYKDLLLTFSIAMNCKVSAWHSLTLLVIVKDIIYF